MNNKDWLCSHELVRFLGGRHRDNDVKVLLHGIYVPLAGVRYDRTADVFVISIDEDSEDYRIATAFDPGDEPR